MSEAKVSPFVYSAQTLDHLVQAASTEPAVRDLVTWYKRAEEDLREYGAMISEELTHYGVAS